MSRWFRFYSDAVRNPKVARLNDQQFRLWVELLTVAAENDGLIPPLTDLKHVLKRRLDHLSRGLDDLIRAELIVKSGSSFKHVTLYENLRPPQNEWSKIRIRVFYRDNFTCGYCGSKGGKLECDHIVPVSRGGSNEDDNLLTACRTCNRRKRDRTPEEMGWGI